MYGTRRASRLWVEYVRRVLEDDVSETISMHVLRQPQQEVHRGGVGRRLRFHRGVRSKLIGNIGPGMPLKVVKLLNRQLAWTKQGFEWRADTKHSQSVLLKHGLEEGKSTSAVSPGSKASGTNIRDGEGHLGVREAKEYASIAGTLLYHALDRPDMQFAVGCLMSAVTKPKRKHLAMVKHCLRYMVGRRCCAWKFDYQEWPSELVILTDAD